MPSTRRLVVIVSQILLLLVLAWILFDLVARLTIPSSGRYAVVPNWPQLPDEVLLGQVAGLDVNSQEQVVVFARADKPWLTDTFGPEPIAAPVVLLLDGRTGELLNAWGENTFVMPHGLTIDAQDNIWLTDVGLHQVFQYSPSGELLLSLGEPGVAGDDEAHFNRPTDVAVAADGTFYVSDGYLNTRVVKFSSEGEFILSWGAPGNEAGEFDTPHSIALAANGRLYVADRGNSRIQLFDTDGRFLAEWKDRRRIGRPWAVRIAADGFVYVVDGGDQGSFPPERARVLKLDQDGRVLDSFGSYGRDPGQFIWPHAIALGDDGAIYVGEVSTGMRVQKFILSGGE